MLSQAKSVYLQFARSTGIASLVANSAWRTDRLTILCYHGISVADEHEWLPGLFISPQLFEQRLRALRDGGYNVLPLSEAVQRLARRTLPPKSVVITFDDGFADFRQFALPLLEKYGFPATVYLTTWYVFAGFPIFNLVVPYMLWKGRHLASPFETGYRWPDHTHFDTEAGRSTAWRWLLKDAHASGITGRAQHELAARVGDSLGIDYAGLHKQRILTLLSPSEVTEVSRRNVSIELHTHRHRTPLDSRALRDELIENGRHIRELTDTEPRHFCYPSGVNRPEMLPVLRDVGIQSATTCHPGLAHRSDNPLLLPRILDLQHMPHLSFAGWLSGVAATLPRRPVASPETEAA